MSPNRAGDPGMRLGRKLSGRLTKVLCLAVLVPGAVLFLLPFFWLVTTSVKPYDQIYTFPPQWIPRTFEWHWYVDGWVSNNFPIHYANTLIVCLLNLVGMLFSCSAAAFAFARLRFRGRDALFLLVLSVLMLPSQVTLIPKFLIFTRLHWANSLRPLIIPSYFAASAFTVFLMRQYFMTIPLEMDDAARIDGVSVPGLYWHIILPMARPVLGVAAIIQFTYDWNDFFYPLIYLSSPKTFTVAVALNMMRSLQSADRSDIQAIMAMTTVSVVPLVALFFLAQRYFVQGIVVTGVKG